MIKKAFTIAELLVAMGLLTILIAISGLIFSNAVRIHRVADATAEISTKLYAITRQLNVDFKGLRQDMPAAFWFEYNSDGRRFDQVQFFADGVFETTKQWSYKDADDNVVSGTLEGTTARIYYGHANNVTIDSAAKTRTAERLYNAEVKDAYNRNRAILGRRVHLQTAQDVTQIFPDVTNSTTFISTFISWLDGGSGSSGNYYGNDCFEYETIALAGWANVLNTSTCVDQYLAACFSDPTGTVPSVTDLGGRPAIDLATSDGESLHMIMTQGVGSLSIQLGYMSGGLLCWWPSNNPEDGSTSDFTTMGSTVFGYYMNFSSAPALPDWYDSSQVNRTLLQTAASFPQALKFTFTLYDSRGVFPDGKTFTYIVYLQ